MDKTTCKKRRICKARAHTDINPINDTYIGRIRRNRSREEIFASSILKTLKEFATTYEDQIMELKLGIATSTL
uniref:Uncharacterized protein n=1 Tax=Romanomermis culicivorax TaxID=13658 RepID=A0A915KLX3_ROMCU